MADIERLRKAVGEVGMSEPVIALGRGMGTVADWAMAQVDKVKAYVRPRTPARRTSDIRLPSSRRITRSR